MINFTNILGISSGVLLLICLGLFYCTYRQNAQISVLRHELKVAEENYQAEISNAHRVISAQNKAISDYQADLSKAKQIVEQKQQELEQVRLEKETEIEEELKKDSSSDNQLKIVNRMLHDFAK